MRLRASHLIAAGIALALAGWLASGQLDRGSRARAPDRPAKAEAEAPPAAAVRVIDSDARPVERELVLNGETAAARVVTLRAETEGRVVALGVERGAPVGEDQVVLTLDRRAREARLREAEAMLASRRLEYEAAKRLGEKGFQAETGVAEARARLRAAEALLDQARIELRHTEIRAPFAGVLHERPVELGDYVGIGDPVARVIDLDPLLVVAHAAERHIGELAVGMPGSARLVGGTTLEGRLRYVAREAHPDTRTFKIELEVPNPGHRHVAGISAELRLTYADVLAHPLPASSLVLNDDGVLGIKAVDDGGTVAFHPARIVRNDADAVWLAGLPERIRVITVGQGFVRAGDRVRAMPVQRTRDRAPLIAERPA